MRVSKMTEGFQGRRVPSLVKVTVTALAALLTIAGPAFAQTSPNAKTLQNVSPEWARIQEGLKRAKPMPDPQYGLRPEGITSSGDLVRFDPLTGNISHSPQNQNSPAVTPVPHEEGSPGVTPRSATEDNLSPLQGTSHEGASEISSANGVKPASITPTPPGPLYYPYGFPYRTEFRLLMRFPVAGFADQYFLCSASSVSDFHILSAAHCVYNHDPLEDGSGRGAGFAAEIWAWPAETDVVDPVDHDNWPDFPYGVSKMTYETTYNAWISSSDLDWDFSFIALDRRIGDHLGWMGTEWGVNASSLNFDGYPAQAPYVPSNNPYQYPGFDSGNVAGYTCCRIEMDAYTYGGHSGGGVWRYDGTNRYIEGVNSTSDRAGNAEATLFRAQTHTDLTNIIASDQSSRPPVDLPQLIEYVFNTTSKGLLETSVLVGDSFGLTLNAFNAGYNPAGDTTADIYLTNSEPFSSGTYIGTLNLGSLDAYTYTVQTQNVVVPSSVTPGTYYVGWVLNGANQQYGTDKNYAIITNQSLQVVSLASVSVAPGSVIGGQTSIGTVTLTGAAPAGGATMTLSSNNGAAPVGSSIFINGGSSSADFSIYTTPVSTNTVATIQAKLGGITKTTTLSIQAPVLQSLTLLPTSVSGGGKVTGTLVLSGPAPAGFKVELSSSKSEAKVPSTIHFSPGASSAMFAITTSKVSKSVNVSIKATAGGVSKTATLTIEPTVKVSLSLSPSTVVGGHGAKGKVTINSKAPSGGINIALASSSADATVPASVLIKKGASSATFAITTSKVKAKVKASIQATDGGVSKTEPLTIEP
jgi:V8-like Glu-specific endopeptidase